jgi:hypothetical protein
MSPHDLRSNFQDSGALQLEMRYRTPSLDSVSRWGRAVGALQAPPEKRLYVLISGMATLLFRAIGPEPPHNGRSGSALLQSLPGRSGCIDDRPIDGANTIFLLKSGNLRRGVGRAGLAVTVSSWSPGRPREKGRQTRYLACARPAFFEATPATSSWIFHPVQEEDVMPFASILVRAAVIAVFVVFAAVLIWADFQTRPPRQRVVVHPQGRRSFEAAADVTG